MAIVTGGAGGIGQRGRPRAGPRWRPVVVADLDEAGAHRVAEEIRAAGGEGAAVRVDLADEADVVAMVDATIDRYGGIDILDNNRRSPPPPCLARDTAVAEMAIDVWDQMMSVNLRSQMLTCKHGSPPARRGVAGPS